MLIAIDHGNKQVKTVHGNAIVSGVQKSKTRPYGRDVLKYGGSYYTLSAQRIPYQKDKTTDERFFILSLFAIADPHLSLDADKSMEVFRGWQDYVARLEANWRAVVGEEDTVVIAGDLSWGMSLAGALRDMQFLHSLPGRKLLLKGNHDYWWSSLSKLRAALPEGMFALQNDALALDGHVFCGTRGWMFPTAQQPLGEQDEKVFRRELMRLRMSLDQAARLHGEDLTVLMHYPPLFADGVSTDFTDILEEYAVTRVVYGLSLIHI